MTVAPCTPINSYIGNDTTNSFPFTFPVWNSGQFIVMAAPTGGGSAFSLTEGVDYTVSGLNQAGTPATTGNIILISAGQSWIDGSGFLASGWVLTIVRTLGQEQDTSIRNQGSFFPEVLEDALDYQVMLIQDQSTGTFILTDTVTGQKYLVAMINGVLSQVPIA